MPSFLGRPRAGAGEGRVAMGVHAPPGGASKREGGPATLRVPAQFSLRVGYGEQLAGVVDVSGCVQSGPSPVLASGVLIITSGPAL